MPQRLEIVALPRALLVLVTLVLLAPITSSAQEAPEPPDSEIRAEELVERLREAEREASRLRRELLERSREEVERSGSEREGLLAEAARGARIYRGGAPLVVFPDHPRLGLTLSTDSAPDGAIVDAVLDGGPADEAGLRAGDVITRWNDELLAAGSGTEPTPAVRLIDLARELEVGEEVRLTYRRNGEERAVVVKAQELAAPLVTAGLDELRALRMDELRAPRLGRRPPIVGYAPDPLVLPLGRHRLLHGIELVPLNPELGEYFATESGLLVLTAPDDDLFDLRGGDVILSIGDREPRDATHVLRILQSYTPGETINLHILRKGKRTVLTASVPERDHARFAPSFGRHGI